MLRFIPLCNETVFEFGSLAGFHCILIGQQQPGSFDQCSFMNHFSLFLSILLKDYPINTGNKTKCFISM